MEDLNGKNIPDAPLEGSERIELTDDAGHVVGIADVGVGHPDDPYRGQLLSVDDERRIDEKGELVVRGVPWSEAGTGLWLTVAVGAGLLAAHVPAHSGKSMSISPRLVRGADMRIFVGTFRDVKPRWQGTVTGACLELPHDLGRDDIKHKYVTEWLAHTVIESLALIGLGFDMGHKELGEEYQTLALMAAMAAEDAIHGAGL